MIVDVVLAALVIFAIAQGFNRGLVPTLFAILGYLGGGILGLLLAKELSADWNGLISVIGLYLFAIFLGAQVGSWALARMGSGIRKRALFGPFKFLDSVLGGALALLQVALLAVVVLKVIEYLPWSLSNNWIDESRIYNYFSRANLLSFQISDLLKLVSSHLDQLKS